MRKVPFSSGFISGFTLLELLVVLAVASVLMAIAIPQFQSLSISSARAQGSTTLLAALNQARAEAIARGGNVNICRRNYFGSSGTPACATSTGASWAQGWIVYRDTTSTGTATTPAADTDIIGVFDPVGSVTADGEKNAFRIVATGNVGSLQYAASGRASQAINFTICDTSKRLQDSRQVTVQLSGYVSLISLDTSATTTACG